MAFGVPDPDKPEITNFLLLKPESASGGTPET